MKTKYIAYGYPSSETAREFLGAAGANQGVYVIVIHDATQPGAQEIGPFSSIGAAEQEADARPEPWWVLYTLYPLRGSKFIPAGAA
mgnify:CR=1 FL=1